MAYRLIALLLIVLALPACAQPGGKLSALHELAKSCPDNHKKIAAYVALDEHARLRGAQLTEARVGVVNDVATQVAVCGGHLRVVAFSASPAASVSLFDDALDPPGATKNAQLLRVPAMSRRAADAVRRSLPAAQRRLTPSGSAPVAQLEVAREYAAQLGSGYQLRVLIETSGAVGRDADVPRLNPDSFVTFAGLGRTGLGRAPTTAEVDGVRAYYDAVCRKTGASKCLALTDITPVGA